MTSTQQSNSSEGVNGALKPEKLKQSQDDGKAAKTDGNAAKNDEKIDQESGGEAVAEEHNYPGLLPAAMLMLAICVATFLVSLVCPVLLPPPFIPTHLPIC